MIAFGERGFYENALHETAQNAFQSFRPFKEAIVKQPSRPRKTANLSESTHQQLNLYALMASAAGVSVLALAPPTEAKIVYTPTHVVISPYGVHLYDLVLNHGGKTDFVLQSKFYSTGDQSAGTQRLIASGATGNSLENSQGFAAALEAGKIVGPHHNFQNRGVMASDFGSAGASTSIKRGPWVNVNNRYLGLKFKIKGQTHYGWARLSVQAKPGTFFLQATLTGYAYETIANKPIIAGKTKGPDVVTLQPVSLGHLAAGASAIPAWRRSTLVTPDH
jgi:hypothetical protein